MRQRPTKAFQPRLEEFEAKQLLSAGASSAHAAHLDKDSTVPAAKSDSHALAESSRQSETSSHRALKDSKIPPAKSDSHAHAETAGKSSTLPSKFLVYRVTNPSAQNPYHLVPPFQQVAVQTARPVPGQVYNVLYVAVKNGTAQTFDAASGFNVRLPSPTGKSSRATQAFPILTGDEQWKPGQVMVFYILSKKYYPLSPEVSAGFEFDLGGRSSTAIPGPSGIYLRVTYDPATFARTLDWIVAYGPGAEGGLGPKYGLPDTAIYEFVAARTERNDFGGYF